MVTGMPTLGVRFDIDKVDAGGYGVACWAVVWSAVKPQALAGALLWEGDTRASMEGRENVYCIAIQSADERALAAAREALLRSASFNLVCANPMLVDAASCRGEPLVNVGRIDQLGQLIGDAWNARPGLKASETPEPETDAPEAVHSAENVGTAAAEAVPKSEGQALAPGPSAPESKAATGTWEATGNTLEEARARLMTMVPRNHVVSFETIDEHGLQRRATERAATIEKALHTARQGLPKDAVVLTETTEQDASRETIEVEAMLEAEARLKAAIEWPKSIASVTVKRQPKAGLLGLGRRTGVFEIVATQPAQVRIEFRCPARIRANSVSTAQIPTLARVFWKDGDPIRREFMDVEQQAALTALARFAADGDRTATEEIAKIAKQATSCVVDADELARYHGYQRQQVAADILGLIGAKDGVAPLQAGLRLQETRGGGSQHSNHNTIRLVTESIERALKRIESSNR